MARWIDLLSLALTFSIVAAVLIGIVRLVQFIQQIAQATKQSLHNKGVDVSRQGISVKTNKHLDRDQYLDVTQRGFIKAYNHSSYGHDLGAGVRSHSAESIHHEQHHEDGRERHGTFSGTAHVFGLKKTLSGH
ncbi:hypothetical protein WOLCODRAFT_139468 [Wolfiporia cocos MD-104 SS10]|uniref:Uncharacterized protein n=1 Tax=Wolfiporia cocos (strain MD-104) TaxID=742152 RepID=A0A2H3IXD2_WOLCO|nr:hypothetical protein WOLCODRAFT_139468 [Wolfiporia cocos MD-104 SS10]